MISHKRQCKQEENKMTSLNCYKKKTRIQPIILHAVKYPSEIWWNKDIFRHFPGGPVAKTPCSQCSRPRFKEIFGQETRCHMLQLRVPTCHNEERRSVCCNSAQPNNLKKRKKVFSDKTKLKRICQQETYTTRNVKGNSWGW